MKTKIIYISGNEVFEMSEIRAAFDEVRDALGLDKDTILFGVPVDCDNALQNTVDSVVENVADKNQSIAYEEELQTTTPEISVIPEEELNVIDEKNAEITEVLEEKNEAQYHTETALIVDTGNQVDENVDAPTEDKVIPILSVLGGGRGALEPQATDSGEISVDKANTPTAEVVSQEEISDVGIETQLVAPETQEMDSGAQIEQVSIGDMIDEEAPTAPMEKTLEQLLESMTPLREDVAINQSDIIDNTTIDFEENDTDATLAQLASEFAENEDKIPTTKKAEHQGKIGKLKNILPFKKAKRDDGGLMGDLFGWAGIAANDEDFSIPGFFANAKKQGA